MKALTICQPWATLVTIGAKRIETRSWSTTYRGPLAIHAAAGLGPVGGVRGLWEICHSDPFRAILDHHGWLQDPSYWLPRGKVVAVAELRDVRIIGRELNGVPTYSADDMISAEPVLGNERAFGDYSPGRFAWLLDTVRALPEPIPARGALGLWNWDAPEGVTL